MKWGIEEQIAQLERAVRACKQAISIAKHHGFYREKAQFHHQLGIIYSERLSDPKMKSIWAAFSANSFEEALSFFTKDDHLLEYVAICNDYGHAIMNYPELKLNSNLDKASYYFYEALALLPVDEHSEARSRTLLNIIEANLVAKNVDPSEDEQRLRKMKEFAEEVLEITTSNQLTMLASDYLTTIDELMKKCTKSH